MDKIQFFTTGLLLVSALIGLVTQGVKKIMTEHNKTYRANTLAGIVALVVSTAAGVMYTVYVGEGFSTPVIVEIVSFVFASWLCAMVGYDKVIQTISQFKN